MIFILLAEIVVLHVRPIAIDVQGLSLEFVSRSTFGGVVECLDDSIQVLLAVSISARILENRKRGSLRGSGRSFKHNRCFRSCKSFGASRSLKKSRFV